MTKAKLIPPVGPSATKPTNPPATKPVNPPATRPATAPATSTASADSPFLATPAARKVHEEVLAKLAACAATPQARDRLRHLPFPPSPAAAALHAEAVMADKATVSALDADRVRGLLSRLAAVPEAPPRQATGRLVVCESEELRERWETRGLHRHVRLAGFEGLRQADDYDLVVYLYDEGRDVDLDSVVELAGDAPMAQVAPESVLAWFAAHRPALAAMAELAALVGHVPGLANPAASQAAQALALLDSCQAAAAGLTVARLRHETEQVRNEVDRLVRERTAGLVLTGADVLQSLGRSLPRPLQQAVDEALTEGSRLLHERTGLRFQPYLAGAPVRIDDEALDSAVATLAARSHAEAFTRLGRTATELEHLRPAIERELAAWREFDVRFALGLFALRHDLHPARFGDGLRFSSSVHLDFAADATAQRIGYQLGCGNPVALLTGANSGGKTTLLEHLLQLVAMARLGLPVVGADVEVPWVDEVHYVTARRSLDAGAFESFLRSFIPVALGDRRRLVLADEVEAVTEAEAASRIVGCFLDRIHASGSLAVVVSHMAPQILLHTHAAVRVDGIEATGLDARNRLVVDRNPRLGSLARSTPELIVQRLAATAKGEARQLFQELLARFQATAPARRPRRGELGP